MEDLSAHKAAEVSARYPEALVIASDTVVSVDGKILGKPRSEEEMLQVSGVGLKKQARYGKRFLQAIEEYMGNQDR